MRGELRSGLILAAAAMGAPLLASCADVFGLDEPTVREGAGGGATSSTVVTSTSSSSTSGTGGATTSSSSGDGGSPSTGGAGGAGGCDTPADCGDDNPCTAESCADGVCSTDPIPDGPLVENPEDCRTITCVAGEVSDVPNDAEDPGDVSFPCEATICQAGAPTPVFAPEGTSCGAAPQECNGAGLCIGCDPAPPDSECAGATVCAAPTCVDPGVCDPGYLPANTPLADPVDGDCQDQACTGSSAAPVSVADDGDVPADVPCGDRTCIGGIPSTTTLTKGTPCFGEPGVCDGLGILSTSCRVCQDTSMLGTDAGCSAAAPTCDENSSGGEGICRECVFDIHCDTAEGGDECLPSYVCGCNGGIDCQDSPNGEWCFTAADVCGCQGNADCSTAARGDECIAGTRCGCFQAFDCDDSAWGGRCTAGVCGCTMDSDCPDLGQTCNMTTSRCE